ncbi:MAG TPA: ribonuclease HII, partial [Chitinophagales bacterium]
SKMLLPFYQDKLVEAGCDEAGRGCLAGSVFAAAVILPRDYKNARLNDSKKLSEKIRDELRIEIERDAIAFAVAQVSAEEIDQINILNASYKAMHLSLDQLKPKAEFILVDGNRFKAYKNIPHQTIVKGDGKYLSIAAASILAKTYRDEWIVNAHEQFPEYDWANNKGYGTEKHRKTIIQIGFSPLHRKSFQLKEMQLGLF